MKPLRVAIAGFGWWGQKIANRIGSDGIPMELASIVEPQAGAAEQFARERGIALHRTLDAVLGDPSIEAVLLVTPHEFHDEQVAAVAQAGKHVFCEKPLSLTARGAARSIALCAEAGVVLGIGHERRFEPPIAELLAAADRGRLGRVMQIEANFSHDKFVSLDPTNWRLDPRHAPAAGMTATGIHLTDLAVRLMGRAREATAIVERLASDIPGGDTIGVLIGFEGGGTAYVAASLATPFISRFAVFGSQGWMEVRDRAHVEAPEGWTVIEGRPGRPIAVRDEPAAEAVDTNLLAFARACRGLGDYPITGEQMIANAALLEAIVTSASERRTVQVMHPGAA